MEIMGWSAPNIAKRYMQVTDELVTAIAVRRRRTAVDLAPGEQLRQTRRTPVASTWAAGVSAVRSGGCGI